MTDRHVATAQAAWLASVLGDTPTLVLEPGEEAKSLANLGRILDFLAAQGLDRTGALVAAGAVPAVLAADALAKWVRARRLRTRPIAGRRR